MKGDVMRGAVAWGGTFQIIIETPEGPGKRRVINLKNLITDAGLNYLAQLLNGVINAPTEIRYFAFGTSNVAPAATDIKLGNEVFRKVVTKQERPGTGQLVTTVFVASYELVGTAVAEIGIFAGPTATATANSGVMLARVLYSRTKTALESWQVQRTDTIQRAP